MRILPAMPVPADAPPPRSLAIGCAVTPSARRLGPALITLGERWPGIAVGICELPRNALFAGVRSGELALAITPEASSPELETTVLWRDLPLISVAATHPLATLRLPSAVDLAGLLRLMPREPGAADIQRFLGATYLPTQSGPIRLVEGNDRALARALRDSDAYILDSVETRRRPTPGVTRRLLRGAEPFAVSAHWRAPLSAPAADLIALLSRPRP